MNLQYLYISSNVSFVCFSVGLCWSIGSVSVSKNNSHSTSGNDVAASLVTSGNGDSDTSNLPSPNNSEEPLPLELHSAPLPAQISAPHSAMTCYMNPMYVCV